MLKPLALLFNGLLAYQPHPLTPLSPLAARLEQAGWEVCITNHLNTGCAGRTNALLIIGHSQGGATALSEAARHQRALVITFDAVRMDPCRTHCINFRTAGYPYVRGPGAVNIDAPGQLHISLPLVSSLQQKVMSYAEAKRNARIPHAAQHDKRSRPLLGSLRKGPPPSAPRQSRSPLLERLMGVEPHSSEDLFLADRWPEHDLGTLELTFEQLCDFHPTEGCP
jgi:hypothetical protein